jgi:hypothetical protein
MKITRPAQIQHSSLSSKASKKSAAAASGEKAAGADSGVSLSGNASFIQSIRDSAQLEPAVRSEMVDQAKNDIAAGELGSPKDYEKTITALLMEL